MVSKLVVFFAVICVALALASAEHGYEFNYHVKDPYTGDYKKHEESRHGDTVKGSYSVVDADGIKRTVDYTANAHEGFKAEVHTEKVHH